MIQKDKASSKQSLFSNTWLANLKEFAIIVLIGFIIYVIIRTFFLNTFFVPSGSMKPTFEIDDRMFVNQLEPKLFGIERGDVVVFYAPENWITKPDGTKLPASKPPGSFVDEILIDSGLVADDSHYVVKRVIGMPGDKVQCCSQNGKLMINGVEIDETYLAEPNSPASKIEFDITVPDGKIWVLGDNRNNSGDSRYHMEDKDKGFVALENVKGKAFAKIWPLNRIDWISNHREVFKNVPDPK